MTAMETMKEAIAWAMWFRHFRTEYMYEREEYPEHVDLGGES